MSAKQKALAWGMGILLWTNLLSILLSIWQFGHIDWTTAAQMGAIVLLPLAVGILFLYRFRGVAEGDHRGEAPSPARISGTRAPVRVGQ